MNPQGDIRVYDYVGGRNTVPMSDRYDFDADKLVNAGAVFITPAMDGDPNSPTYKEWLDEDGSHLITLYNVEHSSPDGWIRKAITKKSDTSGWRDNFIGKLYDGKYNQILWSLEKLGIDPNDMVIEDNSLQEDINRIREVMGLLNEKEMVFSDSIDSKHKERIDRIPNGIFADYDYESFKNLDYPENHSDEAEEELELLADIDVDTKFVEDKDDVYKSFKKFLKSKDLKFDEELFDKILKEAGAVILDVKYHYNRPRPFQLNKVYDIDMKNKMMDSMKSPSFPSGHSAQGRLMGEILSYFYPEYKKDFIEIADDISYSRNMAKAHFPSDTEVGKELGSDMFNFLKDSGYLDSIEDKL